MCVCVCVCVLSVPLVRECGRLKEGTKSVATKTPTKSSEDQAELLKCFQKMQSKMLATQANAVELQNFPPLLSFTGKG